MYLSDRANKHLPMPSSKRLFHHIRLELDATLPEAEREAMAFMVLDHLGISGTDVVMDREVNDGVQADAASIIRRVNQGEPIQYVLGYAWFHGLKFRVGPSVLIPRPETEWLVDMVIHTLGEQEAVRVLDLGTGSGAIAIAVARARPGWMVTATDLSSDALQLASNNAQENGVNVRFMQHDMRSGEVPDSGPFQVMVSNPPYIPLSEKDSLPLNVAGHEPHTALFTSDPEGLEFYQAIARMATSGLVPGGLLAVEIHEKNGPAVAVIFSGAGLETVKVIRDTFGKERYVTANRA